MKLPRDLSGSISLPKPMKASSSSARSKYTPFQLFLGMLCVLGLQVRVPGANSMRPLDGLM